MTLDLRDELEAIIRGWNAYEIGRGAAPVIDFDFRPDVASALPITSRLEAWTRCSDVLRRAEEIHDEPVAQRARADVTYLGALLGERLPLADYIRRTQGCEALGWPEHVIELRRAKAQAALDAIGVTWGPDTGKDLTQAQGPISAAQAEAEIRQAAEDFEPAVRAATGATAPFTLSIETADIDAYWGYWLDGAGSNVRLRLNLREARFTHVRARQFALHEVLGHGLESASIADYCLRNEVPWVRLLSVHAQQQTLLEGLAQALPLLVAPEDQALAACVRLDHYVGLVRGNLHVAINRGDSIQACADYARARVPYWDDENISNQLTDRSVNPQLRSYLWSYAAGIDWFVNLVDEGGPVASVLQAAYREPLSPAALIALWPNGPDLFGSSNASNVETPHRPTTAIRAVS
jgi:hypothetical protein